VVGAWGPRTNLAAVEMGFLTSSDRRHLGQLGIANTRRCKGTRMFLRFVACSNGRAMAASTVTIRRRPLDGSTAETAIVRLVGALLLEQNDEWAVQPATRH